MHVPTPLTNKHKVMWKVKEDRNPEQKYDLVVFLIVTFSFLKLSLKGFYKGFKKKKVVKACKYVINL